MPQSLADPLQSIPMSPSLSETLGRAQDSARAQSHRALLLEHLLLALTEDPDAAGVLRACNVDLIRLGTDVSGYLGRLTEDMRAPPGTEPIADPELVRVIEAARQAASQSKRRGIDGAIVLAAIVGDGKSPAAALLETHGMTFEEAIKSLQKASAQARSKQYAPGGARAVTLAPEPPAPKKEPAPPPASERPNSGGSVPEVVAAGQTADEILAAARARIQQRSGKADKKPEANPEPETPPLMSLSAFTAARAQAPPEPAKADGQSATAASPADASAAAPPAAASGPPAQKAEAAAPAPGPAPVPPLPVGPRPMPLEPQPPPPRAVGRPKEGPPPPPPPPPRRGERSQRADVGGPPRRPAPNGALGGAAARRPVAEPARPPSRQGQRSAAGPLHESIPRRMRVGAPTSAQVRISRDKVDGLVQLLMGPRGAHQHPDNVVARVLTVRLRAPDGGFAIEAGTPETQWVDTTNAMGIPLAEPIGWRWTVTPQRRGRRRLLLEVAARTVGREGITAETSPPERVIDVTVSPNRLRRVGRLLAIALAFGGGAGLGWLIQEKGAHDLLDLAGGLVHTLLGLLTTSGFLGGSGGT
jgi:hypothetical protein